MTDYVKVPYLVVVVLVMFVAIAVIALSSDSTTIVCTAEEQQLRADLFTECISNHPPASCRYPVEEVVPCTDYQSTKGNQNP